MSEATEYRQKVAEKIHLTVTDALRYDSSTPSSPLDLSVPITAVLADEGVVDPEVTRQLQQGLRNMQDLRDAAEKQLAAARNWAVTQDASLRIRAATIKRLEESCEAYAERQNHIGMEQAAKMVENVRPWPGQIALAAAIRAESKQEVSDE